MLNTGYVCVCVYRWWYMLDHPSDQNDGDNDEPNNV